MADNINGSKISTIILKNQLRDFYINNIKNIFKLNHRLIGSIDRDLLVKNICF